MKCIEYSVIIASKQFNFDALMESLPRNLIKWLQGLDLSYSIKNIKRDFTNGFLVAEILSKYYPAEVQMHSFDTGTAKGAKKSNWVLLERIFLVYLINLEAIVSYFK